ncbi:MAG TPA: M20 family metallopeptidase [Terriglobales bacterium]|nr:M20 family metallopeptidase [Terriglobales bacterium]
MLSWLESRREDMLAQLRQWVEVETPSLEPERVRALAAQVAHVFAGAGCTATLHEYGLQLDCGHAPRVLLLGHLDTVYAAGTLARMPYRREGERVFGPGVFDMKGGVVQALYALQALRAAGRAPEARLLFVFDEEIGSKGSRPLTERLAREAAAVLVLEPAAEGGRLKTARKGIALYQLEARGVAAHAGVDFEKGSSAIAALARGIAELAAWCDLERGVTLNPGVIAGGTRANVVAESARAELDVRAWSAADLEDVDRRLRKLPLAVTGGINRPPMEASAAGAALFARAQAAGRSLGLALEAARTGGGSDGNFTAALGVPTLDGLGMVGAGAHAAHELIEVGQFAPRTALLAELMGALG